MQAYNKTPYPIEKILSVGTYLTAGGIGFVWLIIAALTRKRVNSFLMYHILQSIFISMLYMIISLLCSFIYKILYFIPLINAIPYLINLPIPIIFNMSIVQIFTTSVIMYLAVTSGMGYYSYLPWISNIIKSNQL